MFTLRTGPSRKPFRVHKELLGEISRELRGHVFNEMKEGQEGSMDMAHVSEETMCQFLEFCYTGDYPELKKEPKCSGWGDDDDNEEGPPSSEQLLPNAKLYVFADMYNIPQLKEIAFSKITAHIVRISYSLWDKEIEEFVQLFKYTFENLPEREEMDQLLEYLGKYAAWALNKFKQSENFLNLFVGNDRVDFIKLIFDNVREGSDAPWQPRNVFVEEDHEDVEEADYSSPAQGAFFED